MCLFRLFLDLLPLVELPKIADEQWRWPLVPAERRGGLLEMYNILTH